MMVCLEVPNSRATALILAPAFRRSNAACRWSGVRAGGRPNRFPAALAIRALNQQVFFKLGHRRNDLHGHLSGHACKVHAAQRETVYANTGRCQQLYGLPHVHCVTAPGDATVAGQTVSAPKVTFIDATLTPLNNLTLDIPLCNSVNGPVMNVMCSYSAVYITRYSTVTEGDTVELSLVATDDNKIPHDLFDHTHTVSKLEATKGAIVMGPYVYQMQGGRVAAAGSNNATWAV